MSDLPYQRTIIGVMAAAAMEGACEATLDEVRPRQAFDKPISDLVRVVKEDPWTANT